VASGILGKIDLQALRAAGWMRPRKSYKGPFRNIPFPPGYAIADNTEAGPGKPFPGPEVWPDDVLKNILSFLPLRALRVTARCVCKRWGELALHIGLCSAFSFLLL